MDNQLKKILKVTKVPDLVRFGSKNDGGYILSKKSLDISDFLLSFGLSNDWSFEDQVRNEKSLPILIYDHSVSEKYFINKIIISILRTIVFRDNIFNIIRNIKLFRGYKLLEKNNINHLQMRVFSRNDNQNDVTINQIFSQINAKKIFVKMDIEGDEYRVLGDILKYSNRITGMVVEFHYTDHFRQVFIENIIKLIEYFDIIHIHGNNYGPIADDGLPESIEITFLNKELVNFTAKEFTYKFPLKGLDSPNNMLAPDYDIDLSYR